MKRKKPFLRFRKGFFVVKTRKDCRNEVFSDDRKILEYLQ